VKTIKVTCAVIFWEGKVFVAQRPDNKSQPGCWEFPGGKIESGESICSCIIREMDEELGMTVIPKLKLTEVLHTYNDFCIELTPVLCVVKSDHFYLHEHKDAGWFDIDRLESLNWAPADLSIVRKVIKREI
jgi:8-oxo-dGTP diphosphatase